MDVEQAAEYLRQCIRLCDEASPDERGEPIDDDNNNNTFHPSYGLDKDAEDLVHAAWGCTIGGSSSKFWVTYLRNSWNADWQSEVPRAMVVVRHESRSVYDHLIGLWAL